MIVGRKKEIKELNAALESCESEFIVVYGRRRVGKTYLIRNAYQKIFFEHTGVANADKSTQLSRFKKSLKEAGFLDCRNIKSWYDAFDALAEVIKRSDEPKKVIFLDELPWMDTPKSNFVSALESFWNGWASARTDIVLVVCGSATSWIIKKILKNHGGLHNRVTQKIALKPFSLKECEEYCNYRKFEFDRVQILQLYMVLGGIPFYWKSVQRGLSAAQNIDNLFFKEGAILSDEFEALFYSLFTNPEPYISVISALSTQSIGLLRQEILDVTHLSDNKTFVKVLMELEECGIIQKYQTIGKKVKFAFYQLIDNYTLFYFHFIKNRVTDDENFWMNSMDTPVVNTWEGLSFERVCFQHIKQIKNALGIAGVVSNTYSWQVAKNEEHRGCQVDLIIDRKDNTINLCEIKFSRREYSITNDYSQDLLEKKEVFKQSTNTSKSVHLTFITTMGLKHNVYWNDVQSEVTLNQLFE